MELETAELELSQDKVVKTVCQGCHCCCGVLVHVKGGKVVKIEGDPENPLNEAGGPCNAELARAGVGPRFINAHVLTNSSSVAVLIRLRS